MIEKAYSKVRSSGLDWLGGIPEHWHVKRLKYVLDIINGSTPSGSIVEYWDGSINWFTPVDIGFINNKYVYESKRKISAEGFFSCGVKIGPSGSIILSTRAPIGHIAISKVECCINQGCRLLIPRKGNSEYLYYFLLVAKLELRILGQGTTFAELSTSKLASFQVLLPPAFEQKTIASFLDHKTAHIDKLIAEKERLLKLLEEKRIALITQAVTKGLDPNVKMKPSGIDWLGDLPEHWEVKKLKYLTLCNAEILNEDCDPDFTFDYVDISSVNLLHGIVNKETYTFERAPSRARRVVHSGDVIVSTVRTYLKAIAQVEDCDSDTIVSTGFAVLTPLKKLNNDFMYYSIQNQNFIDAIEAHSVGVSYPAINSSDLLDLSINIPSFEEQVIIVNYIKQNISKISELEKSITMAIEKLKEYRISLITAAVTGKIDVRDFTPEEEHEKVH